MHFSRLFDDGNPSSVDFVGGKTYSTQLASYHSVRSIQTRTTSVFGEGEVFTITINDIAVPPPGPTPEEL